jgi:hypothetical protein
MLKQALIACAAVVTLLAPFTSTPANGAAFRPAPLMSSGKSSGPSAAEAYAQKVRAEFGLRSDLGYIRSIEHEPGTSSRDLGTPLTPAESANIKGRRVLSKWVGIVEAAGERQPGYAGVWIDQRAGGILRVAMAGSTAQTAYSRLRGLLPAGARLSYVKATYSLREITQVYDQLTREITGRSSLGRHVVESALTPQYNAITVALDPTTPSAQVAQLSARYGSRVRIIRGVPGWEPPVGPEHHDRAGSRGDMGQLRALERSFGYGDFLNRAGQRFAVTAGHCSGISFYQGYQRSGPYVGGGHADKYVPGGSSNCDCQAVGPLAADKVATGVLVNNNALFHYTVTAGKAQQAPGTPICMSGAQEYDTYGSIICGTVVSDEANVTYDNSGFTLTDATTRNIQSTLPGDSGGPHKGIQRSSGLRRQLPALVRSSRQLAIPHSALALVTTPSTTSTVTRLFCRSDVCHSIS